MTPKQPPLDQIIAELIASFGATLGLVAGAIAKQGDADALHAELQARIAAAKATRAIPPLSIDLATLALAGIEAVRLEKQAGNQNQATH